MKPNAIVARAARFVAATTFVCAAQVGWAQSPPDNMTRLENAATIVEQSTFNKALPLFGDLYWQFTPQRFVVRPRETYILQGGVLTQPETRTEAYARAGLAANLQRLTGYVRGNCNHLTQAQKDFLASYARSRFDALVAQYGAREAAIGAALHTQLQPVASVTLASAPDCARSASAGGSEVEVSGDLLLTALFSALYVDQQYIIVPDRVLASIQAVMAGPPGPWDNRRGRRIFARLHASPAWQNTVRGMRFMYEQDDTPLDRFERDSIYREYAAGNPICRRNADQCRTLNTVALSLTSALKVDMLFREQVDFVLAHELGHHALGHASQPIGDCATEKKREADADLFAVALMRPPEGLFTQPTLAPNLRDTGTDNRFKSGLDVFMVQSHRVAALTNGDNCAYPTFEERLKAARAFELVILGGH